MGQDTIALIQAIASITEDTAAIMDYGKRLKNNYSPYKHKHSAYGNNVGAIFVFTQY